MKNQYRGGGLPKKGVPEQFANLRRSLARKRGRDVFEGGVDTPMHTMSTAAVLVFTLCMHLFPG